MAKWLTRLKSYYIPTYDKGKRGIHVPNVEIKIWHDNSPNTSPNNARKTEPLRPGVLTFKLHKM